MSDQRKVMRYHCGDYGMEDSADGHYVHHADYAALEQEIAQLRAEVERLDKALQVRAHEAVFQCEARQKADLRTAALQARVDEVVAEMEASMNPAYPEPHRSWATRLKGGE